ncbi:MAG: MarR family winged helix-turn-helix transcriptional regulator [Cytophagaceae bacterium]
MAKSKSEFYEAPLGLHFSNIAKQYIGVVSNKLSSLEIDRYFYSLVVIDRFGDSLSQQQLADLLCIDKVSVVRIVDYLTKKGFVKRKQNKEDRREHFLSLTEKGKKHIPEIKKALEEANQATLKSFTSEEQKLFHSLIQKVVNNLSVLPADKVDLNFRKIKK